jgi:cobalamin biosynthesis protein CobT
MGIETAIMAATLAVSAGSAYTANQNARRSVASQNTAIKAQQEQNELQASRQRRDAIRSARVATARATNAAATQGALGSSGSMGGLASIQSQLGSNLSFLDTYGKLSDVATESLGRANVFRARAESAQAISQLALATLPYAGKAADGFNKIFKAS